MVQKHHPDERYFDLRFLTAFYFAFTHELINEDITRGSESFQSIVYPLRERDLVFSWNRKRLFVSTFIDRRAPFALSFDPIFFPEAEAYRRRYGKYFQCEGVFLRFPRRLPETRSTYTYLMYHVKGILGGFGAKDLLDSPRQNKSTSPFRIASQLLLPPESPLRVGGVQRAQKFVGPRQLERERELSEERLVNLESLFNSGRLLILERGCRL